MASVMERLVDCTRSFMEFLSAPATRTSLYLHVRHVGRIACGALLVTYLCLACSVFFVQYSTQPVLVADSPSFHVDTSSGRIRDRYGRERIFHGVNVVVKDHPWHPEMDYFSPQMSFCDEDIQILQGLGLNVVRLGVMWPGVHPSMGTVNHTYLGIFRDLVRRLHVAGIYTLVDFHQDVFTSRFCGEGVPAWLLDDVPFSFNAQKSGSEPVHEDPHVGSLPAGRSDMRKSPDDSHPQQSTTQRQIPSSPSTSRKLISFEQSLAASTPHTTCAPGSPCDSAYNKSSTLLSGLEDLPEFCVGFAVCMTPEEYAASFPEPLLPRFGRGSMAGVSGPVHLRPRLGHNAALSSQEAQQQQADKEIQDIGDSLGKNPSEAQCSTVGWGLYHFTYAVSRAFQDLYDNRWGWRDRLAEYWRDVTLALKGQEGVLGFDLMNEPWVGDIFLNPLLMAPGVGDRLNFQPLYDHLQRAIRSVDASRLLFFESATFDDLTSGFTQVPGGQGYANMSVLSYHYYRPPNVAPRATFTQRDSERTRLQCGWMLTEFNIPNSRPDWLTAARAKAGEPLKPGLACLPVHAGTYNETSTVHGTGSGAVSTECSDSEGSCKGESAQGWGQFVEAWGAELNRSTTEALRKEQAEGKQPLCARRLNPCGQSVVRGLDKASEAVSAVVDVDASVHSTSSALEVPGIAHRQDSEVHMAVLAEPSLNLAYERQRSTGKEHIDSRPSSSGASASSQGVPLKAMAMKSKGSVSFSPERRLPKKMTSNRALEELQAPFVANSFSLRAVDESFSSEGNPSPPHAQHWSSSEPYDNEERPGLSKHQPVSPGWNELVETLDLADEHLQSWVAWEYKPFIPKTGTNYGLFQPDGTLHPLVKQFFWRTYPVAVAGRIGWFNFDADEAVFEMVFWPTVAKGGREGSHSLSLLGLGGLIRSFAKSWSQIHKDRGVPSTQGPTDESPKERATEIYVCCNRAMEVTVNASDVEIVWSHGGAFVQLIHSRTHSNTIPIHVRIKPKT